MSPEAIRLARESALPVVRLTGGDRAEVVALPSSAAERSTGDGIVLPALDATGRRQVFQRHPDWPPPAPERDLRLTSDDAELSYVRLTPRSLWHPRASLVLDLSGGVVIDLRDDAAQVTVHANPPGPSDAIYIKTYADLEAPARYLVDVEVTALSTMEFSLLGITYELPQSESANHLMAIIEPAESGTFDFLLNPAQYESHGSTFLFHALEITKLE